MKSGKGVSPGRKGSLVSEGVGKKSPACQRRGTGRKEPGVRSGEHGKNGRGRNGGVLTDQTNSNNPKERVKLGGWSQRGAENKIQKGGPRTRGSKDQPEKHLIEGRRGFTLAAPQP